MENSRLIGAERHSASQFYTLVSGERLEWHGAPARVAWELEHLAALRGWPAGESLGSEAWLRARLKVSRETLREAIRILESRGAMKMQRGRTGGLTLLQPPIGRTATALVTYLRATGITAHQFAQSVRGLDLLVSWEIARKTTPLPSRRAGESLRHWLTRASGRQTYLMYLAALDQLAPPCQADAIGADAELSFARCDAAGSFRLLSATPFVPAASQDGPSPNEAHARAGAIALRMIDLAGDCPNANLGNEADLCEQFDTSRSLVRQALRILQDLDLIHVRRGRGGGHVFKQPSPIGIIRQVFAWLAARNCDPFALNALMWDFNSANLRLAGERLAAMPAPQRDRHCDHLESVLAQAEGHARFIGLQQALAEIADCPAIDTFARCVVSYQARSYGDLPEGGRDPRLQAMEPAIVEALRRCDIDQAERTLRRLQDDAESSVLEQLGLRTAAE